MSELLNSIWPNGLKKDEEGYVTFYPIGTNKVDVPTIRAQWPTGTKLVSPFVYQDDKIVGFCDTKALTVSGNTTICLPYEHIEAEFPAIDKGQLQIYAPNATTKKASWKDGGKEDIPEVQFKYMGCTTLDSVTTVDANYQTTDIVDGVWSEPLWDLTNGVEMFKGCVNLTSFNVYLSSMTDGTSMFSGCDNLTSFSSDLSSLTTGKSMFYSCDNLSSFTSDLPKMTNGQTMFYNCKNLTSFSSDLPKMGTGTSMFAGCDNLTSFTSDASRLYNGGNMFKNCSNLTSFTSDLPRLKIGSSMFYGCKLDAPSVKNIIDTIGAYYSDISMCLGMGCNNTVEDRNLFAQEVGYADMSALLAAVRAKGVDALVYQYNGRPTTTYGLRRPTEDTLPVFVNLEETEDHADYTSMDGSKKYILNYFHETTGSTDGYTQFNSLEEAVEYFNIKPIERN